MIFCAALTAFQSYHRNSSHYYCLSWVSPVLGWGSEGSCKRTPQQQQNKNKKKQRIQCGLNPGPLDYDSKTLPLSHAGPCLYRKLSATIARKEIKSHFNPFPNALQFLCVCCRSDLKTLWQKGEIAPFPTMFCILLENFSAFSLSLKLSSASSFNLEKSKNYFFGKG